jgi:hypothetical protein
MLRFKQMAEKLLPPVLKKKPRIDSSKRINKFLSLYQIMAAYGHFSETLFKFSHKEIMFFMRWKKPSTMPKKVSKWRLTFIN